jgi:hypothetical protein
MTTRRPVAFEIAKAIAAGRVIMTYKVKARIYGGKQLVSVGPYRTAVGERKFAILSNKSEDGFYTTPLLAAQDFVAFVGRDVAWEAVRKAL